MSKTITERLGEDIAHYLHFINDIPEFLREDYTNQLCDSIEDYWRKHKHWESCKEDGLPDRRKWTKRYITSKYEKRIKVAQAFLDNISTPSILNGKIPETISEHAKLEIFAYIKGLEEKQTKVTGSLQKIGASLPNKNEIETIVKEIHHEFKIPKMSDNLRELLAAITTKKSL